MDGPVRWSLREHRKALERMPQDRRRLRSAATRTGSGSLRRQADALDGRLRALQGLVEEHPDLVERDRAAIRGRPGVWPYSLECVEEPLAEIWGREQTAELSKNYRSLPTGFLTRCCTLVRYYPRINYAGGIVAWKS
jgi:hypothetical protein